MTSTEHRVMLSVPGYSTDQEVGKFYNKGSALELAGKIANGDVLLYIVSTSTSETTDVFFTPGGED